MTYIDRLCALYRNLPYYQGVLPPYRNDGESADWPSYLTLPSSLISVYLPNPLLLERFSSFSTISRHGMLQAQSHSL